MKELETLRKQAEEGDPQAMSDLARAYYFGKQVPQDKEKAMALWKESANAGCEDAMMCLAECYFHSQDWSSARDWWEKAAKLGNSKALYNLHVLYYRGLGVKPDEVKSQIYLVKAAHHGCARAMFELGHLYYNGEILPEAVIEDQYWQYLQSADPLEREMLEDLMEREGNDGTAGTDG